jgi:hypothetical protein
VESAGGIARPNVFVVEDKPLRTLSGTLKPPPEACNLTRKVWVNQTLSDGFALMLKTITSFVFSPARKTLLSSKPAPQLHIGVKNEAKTQSRAKLTLLTGHWEAPVLQNEVHTITFLVMTREILRIVLLAVRKRLI